MNDSMPGVSLGNAAAFHQTDKAICVLSDEYGEQWIPKSQIHDDSEIWKEGQEGELVVTEWYAKQKGWV